ncbi:SPOSA6832_02740, partial [Sporobolomyces salmonicolor]
MAAAQSNLKDINLELGGKSPVILFEDANLEEAAKGCAQSLMLNSGQICVANSRIYIHERIRTKFLEMLKSDMKQYKHGHPCDKDTTLGPQADEIQGKAVAELFKVGKKEGKCEFGGNRVGDKGYFFDPTLFVDVPDDARINREEMFGPGGRAPIVHIFEDEKEVIRRANDAEFASIFTTDLDRALRLTKDLKAGGISVNVAAPVFAHELPFGGAKQSGVGREYGIDAVERYLESVLITVAE